MIGFLLRLSIVRDKLEELLMLLIFCSVKPQNGTVFMEALQKPLFPSRIEQNRSVRFFFTTSKNGVFLPSK